MSSSQRRIMLFVVAGVLLAVLVAWFYSLPYLAAKAMKEAAEQNDPVKLATYVDFPAVKESLRASFNVAIAKKMSAQKDTSPMGALGAVMAAAIVSPMIDALVTPESLAAIMQGQKPAIRTSPTSKDSIDSQSVLQRRGASLPHANLHAACSKYSHC